MAADVLSSFVTQAYDQQQQGLVDAASKALSYRQNVLEENIRLTYALQVQFSSHSLMFLSWWIENMASCAGACVVQ